jgi:hypothetical protein
MHLLRNIMPVAKEQMSECVAHLVCDTLRRQNTFSVAVVPHVLHSYHVSFLILCVADPIWGNDLGSVLQLEVS